MGNGVNTRREFFSVSIDAKTRAALEKLAKRNERTLSAEIRVAISRHLENHKREGQ